MIYHVKRLLLTILWVLPALPMACSGPDGADLRPEDAAAQEVTSPREVSFHHEPNVLHVLIGRQPFADYVYYDQEISRPYFAQVKSPSGIQVTRNRPPIDGEDLMDHQNMHPGIWMSFGDLSGNDYWRLKAKVEHEQFIEKPEARESEGTFAVRNYYLDASSNNRIAQEEARYRFLVQPQGYLLIQESSFEPYGENNQIAFGDQEEMGFSVRLSTGLVEQFGGQITDSEGRTGAETIWSNSAEWIDYSGDSNGKWVGVTLMPDPANFRESWFHVRDYGLLTANPFGREAMGKGARSEVVVQKGESLRLRYGVLIHSSEAGSDYDPVVAYRRFLDTIEE